MIDKHDAWYMCSEMWEHITSAEDLARELHEYDYENMSYVIQRLSSAKDLLHEVWKWIEAPLIKIPFD